MSDALRQLRSTLAGKAIDRELRVRLSDRRDFNRCYDACVKRLAPVAYRQDFDGGDEAINLAVESCLAWIEAGCPEPQQPKWDFEAERSEAAKQLRQTPTGQQALVALTRRLSEFGIEPGTERFAGGVCKLAHSLDQIEAEPERYVAIVERIAHRQAIKAARDALV